MGLFRQRAEDLARYGLLEQLRALLNDANTYPLRLENSRLWIRYYEARLKEIGGYPAEAERLYQAIADNKEAEDLLSAYALCDLAWMVSKTDVRQALQFLERVQELYPEPEKLPEPDAKLAFYLLEISEMYRELGRWEDALEYLERAQKFFESIGDLYWLANIHNHMKYYYLDRGMWKEASQKQQQGLQEIARFGKERQSFLEAELLASVSIGWMWAGRYNSTEQQLRRAIGLAEQFGRDHLRMYFLRDFGLALGLQGKLQEASQAFQAGLAIGRQQDPIFEAVTQAMQAIIALKWSGADEAERYFSMCMGVLRQQTGKRWALLANLGAYGRLQELKALPEQAERVYRETLQVRELGQWYSYIGALTGLVRVYYTQGRYTDLTPLLEEAESTAQQYEHYDHLASLSIIRGHLAWDNANAEECQRWDDALHHYQRALIYALRYNRFLLDEALSGLPHGSVVQPIIAHCLNRGSHGQQMLLTLSKWWQEGFNDTGVSRSESISPIPEGIALRDGEDLARRREPGDGSPQKTVLVQLAESSS
jgi:tetratricopeptide (TPR) repeat protein